MFHSAEAPHFYGGSPQKTFLFGPTSGNLVYLITIWLLACTLIHLCAFDFSCSNKVTSVSCLSLTFQMLTGFPNSEAVIEQSLASAMSANGTTEDGEESLL